MRKIVLIILIFIATCSFAINQKLIDGAKEYDAVAAKLSKLIEDKSKELSVSRFVDASFKAHGSTSSESERRLAEQEIKEMGQKRKDFNKQQAAYKDIIKKLEPAKIEYDRQLARREKIKDIIFSTMTILTLFGIAVAMIWFGILALKRTKKLLKEGKITQAEYDAMMTRARSHTFTTSAINPATGLPMTGIGISDAGGNVRGSSHYNDSSSSSYSSSSSSRDYVPYMDRYK